MRRIGRGWLKDGSLMAEFSDHLGNAMAQQKSAMALNAAKVEAELASKAKSEFIANMSHELRTPLNAIIGFSDMLGTMQISDPERVGQYSGYIKQAAEHLLALINGILDVSKIQAGKLAVDLEPVELATLVESCVLIIEARANEERISLILDIDSQIPKINADPLRLKQILINLLSNAVKFTPAKGKVSLSAKLTQENSVKIEISDNGIGMTAKEIDTAMRPFGQVNAGFNKSHEGTGLGLPISTALVLLHGGKLDVKSEKGHGTTVTIELPILGKSLHATNTAGAEPAAQQAMAATAPQAPATSIQ